MARESELWRRLKGGVKELGPSADLQRIENAAGVGHPDVEGCVNGQQIWIELKSEKRPKKSTTPIRFKVRPAQSIWHRQRVRAGFRNNFVLCQVGEGAQACWYLIPGRFYDSIVAPETTLEAMSLCAPRALPSDVLIRARFGW